MPYLIDRHRALYSRAVIAIVALTRRRVRSRVVLEDNSLYNTLTRPATLQRLAQHPVGWLRMGPRRPRRAAPGAPHG